MRTATRLLLAGLFLAGLWSTTAGERAASYYHVKTGGTGGKPVQSESDPGLSFCWNSINAAFAAVKSRTTSGPWIIQVDDEATYDEAVVLSDFQTSSTETLTLTKAPWLVGRPTIYPSQPKKQALLINACIATRTSRQFGFKTGHPMAIQFWRLLKQEMRQESTGVRSR